MSGPEAMRFFPVTAALDADHNGEISSEEIANAATTLKSLDKNGDGKLTADELLPKFPPGGGRGGRGGGAGGRGPGGPGGGGGGQGSGGQGQGGGERPRRPE